jgi:hypothetical protein
LLAQLRSLLEHVITLEVDRALVLPYNTYIDNKGADMTREYTTKLLEMMDEGLISAEAVAEMALAYMSEDDVADMMRANDILLEEDEDYDGQPDEAQEWESFDPDC